MPSPPQHLETLRLTLRPLEKSDAPAIFFGYANDPEATRYVSWRTNTQLAEVERYLEAVCGSLWHKQSSFGWALVLRDSGALVGSLDLRFEAPHRAHFGYIVAKAYWNRGLCTEALSALLTWTRSDPTIQRVWACCDVDNIASARVMEKCGLRNEGILRRWAIHPQLGSSARDCRSYVLPEHTA